MAYGIGMAAVGVQQNAFNMFLLFFYQQVVGLDAMLCGVALFIALLIDAVTDPWVGLLSDRTRSAWGRRHPFMLASIVPLTICFYAVFQPPDGLGQVTLFLWLLAWVIGTRIAMTLFAIPHLSLLAELAQRPDDRVSLQSLRVSMAWLFGLINAIVVFSVLLPPTAAYPSGLGNPDGYFGLALWGAGVMLIATSISTFGTIHATLHHTRTLEPDPALDLNDAVRAAWANRNYRAAVLGGLALTVAVGFHDSLSNYVTTMFWGLSSDQVSVLVVAIMGAALLVLATARPVATRIGKRSATFLGAALVAVTWPLLLALRLADWLPHGEGLLPVLVVASVVIYYGMILGMTMVGAMIADVTDEHELRTGQRQEGLLFSAYTFASKASSGLGLLVAGAALRLSGVPKGASGTLDDPNAALRLVFIQVSIIALLALATAASVRGFRLDRNAHQQVRQALEERQRRA